MNNVIDLDALRERLKVQVKHSITLNLDKWEIDYICKPSQFFSSSSSVFYAENKNTIESIY
ncbi:hypothetical protein AGMMS50284_2760 [Clostridia bacterium]|nr:hypothetical protein AGMMS50284_2760 [Clostridia bacterium]